MFKAPVLLWASVTHQRHQPSKCLSSQPCWIYHLWHTDKYQRTPPRPTGFKAGILWWCIRPHHFKINMIITQQIVTNGGKEKLVEGSQEAPRRMLHRWTDRWPEVRDFSARVSNVQFWMQQHCARCCAKCCWTSIRVRIRAFRECERKRDSWMNWNQLAKGTAETQPGADQNPFVHCGVSVI